MASHNLIGQRFTRLLVIKQASSTPAGSARWICRCDCGCIQTHPIVGSSLRNGNTKSCGCLSKEALKFARNQQTGIRHPNWKGGRYTKDGYVHVKTGPRTYRPEHHIVMEKLLGRPLLPEETVHHKNGVRHDNQNDNLELWCSRHPKGQRVSDLLKWADELIAYYR